MYLEDGRELLSMEDRVDSPIKRRKVNIKTGKERLITAESNK